MLKDSLRGLVSAPNPIMLDDAIEKGLRIETSSTSIKASSEHTKTFHKKDRFHEVFSSKCKEPWECGHICHKGEFEKKNSCYKCKEKWELGHRCGKRGQAHNIEVLSDEEAKGNLSKKARYGEGDLKSIPSKEEGTINKWSFVEEPI